MTRQRFLHLAERVELVLLGVLLAALVANVTAAIVVWWALR